jgi:hypothetical protein
MDNRNKIDRLHDLLPRHLNTRGNVNWTGLLDAIGEQDQTTSNLIAEVRKQFFVKTANRPYLDRLAANNKIARPRLVGMNDTSFRDYIPVLSYKPKQVKLIIDALLDIFFFKESTTAYITTQNTQPYTLQDGWELELLIDGLNSERIVFNTANFTNIAAATADEIVGAYNKQAKYSYATAFYDSISKQNYIRIFTATIGSKGSIQITGGRANISLRLDGFIDNAGQGADTQWTVSRIGDTTTFQHVGGTAPGLNQLQVGDLMIISGISGNIGTFSITAVDLQNSALKFINLFSTAGTYTQTSSNDVKFCQSSKFTAFINPKRAITWETSPGEITVEMPTTPPVVKRSLKGSTHLNGAFSLMTNRNSGSSLTVASAVGFPKQGTFIIEPLSTISTLLETSSGSQLISNESSGRLSSNLQKYSYTSRIVQTTTGTSTTGSNQITVASVAGLSNGLSIFMSGLREDAVIVNIVGLVITSSVAATTGSAGTVEFGGSTLIGVSPTLPVTSALNQLTPTSISRAGGVVTVNTASAHGYLAGETAIMSGNSGIVNINIIGDIATASSNITNIISTVGVYVGQLVNHAAFPLNTVVTAIISPTQIAVSGLATATAAGATIPLNENLNGSFSITSATSTQFTYFAWGANGSPAVVGTCRVERLGLANSGSKIILVDAQLAKNTRITGTYQWDTAAAFVLSDATSVTSDRIRAGTIVRLLNIGTNSIPATAGTLIFDYGLATQEGPVKYLYKPAPTIVAIDPSYVFQKDHSIGSAVVALNHLGPHVMSNNSAEYGSYITDPSEARVILEDLIRSVKSAGIFVNFLVRYPEQIYGVFDSYGQQGLGAGKPWA